MADSIEIHDAMVCKPHRMEICSSCSADFREENDAFFGFEPQDREPMKIPEISTNAKEGSYPCKKHSNAECSQCFNWKKQLTKLHKDAKKK